MRRWLIFFGVLLFLGCEADVQQEVDTYNIAQKVAKNTSWPMLVEGVFEEVDQANISGVDVNIQGMIRSSSSSFVTVYILKSLLARNNISSGDKVLAQIKPSNIDVNFYDIVSIEKNRAIGQ
jgi:transcription termination factor Rho